MPSPFPGMDPFIESQRWSDFHAAFITFLRACLFPKVLPSYFVDIEESVYLLQDEEPERLMVPDISVGETGEWTGGSDGDVAVLAVPVTLTLPQPRVIRNKSLAVRSLKNREIVTVIEVLSPWNKTGDGRVQYLEKRDALLSSTAHLVELDLLRGGKRLPTKEKQPPGDYYAFVSRRRKRPKTEVYAWSCRHSLPTIPIPLARGDADVTLELQAAFDETYDRAGYKYSMNYQAEVSPPLRDEDQAWIKSLLKTQEKSDA